MKLEETSRQVVANLPGRTKEFTIAQSGIGFRILVDQLYGDKIRSIVRELCTNAFDGHKRCGNESQPFNVTLPTRLNPNFSVRDFGCGMDDDFVMELYSTLFHSDKRGSNNEVGMLGLGSKSPFAYTDSFHLACYDGATKRIYVVQVGEDDIPAITAVGETPSTEPRGFEVSFAVSPDDFGAFRTAMREVADGFDVRPIFADDPGPYQWSFEMVRDGYTIKVGPNRFGEAGQLLYFRQGCVVYPAREMARRLTVPYGWTVLIDVPIGALSVTASREALEMKPRTVENIERAIAAANGAVHDHVTAILASAADEFERSQLALQYVDWTSASRSTLDFNVPRAFGIDAERVLKAKSDSETLEDALVKAGMPRIEAFTLRSRSVDVETRIMIGPKIVKSVLLVVDDGTKIQRRQLRLMELVRRNQLALRISPKDKARVAAALHVTPERILTIDAIPDVAPRSSGGGGGSGQSLVKAAELLEPWLPREGNTWRLPEFGKVVDHGVPQPIAVLARGVGMTPPTKAHTLTPSQARKADQTRRWDVMLRERLLSETAWIEACYPHVLRDTFSSTLSSSLNRDAAQTVWQFFEIPNPVYSETVSVTLNAAMNCTWLAHLVTRLTERARARVNECMAQAPLMFKGAGREAIDEYLLLTAEALEASHSSAA